MANGLGRQRIMGITIGIAFSLGPVAAQILPAAPGLIEVFTISGQVTDFDDGAFTLRHTRGFMELTFDGWPSSREAGQPFIEIGDNVTVSVEMNEAFVGGETPALSRSTRKTQGPSPRLEYLLQAPNRPCGQWYRHSMWSAIAAMRRCPERSLGSIPRASCSSPAPQKSMSTRQGSSTTHMT